MLVLLCSFGFLLTSAQQITKAEYYLDTDPGAGNGVDIPLTPGESIDLTTSIDLSGLGEGQHNVVVRVMDENGVWSTGGLKIFYIEPEASTGQIIAAEYFFDTDPGVGNGTSIPFAGADIIDEIQSIPIPSDMEFGEHRLYIRTQSSDDLWSHYMSHYFVVCDYYGPISGFDYQVNPNRWVDFTDQSENTTSHLWDFDDGNTDTSANPLHNYTDPGIYNVIHYASSGCGTDTLEKTIEVRGIYDVKANKGSNTGATTVYITGYGFNENVLPSLNRDGYSPIEPDSYSILNGITIKALFDLRGQEIGDWDVNVELPGDTTFVELEGFEIVNEPQANLVITFSGRSKFLVNREYSFIVSARNKGFEDVIGLPLVMKNFEDYMILGIEEINKTDLWSDPHFGDLTAYIEASSIDSSNVDFNTMDDINAKHGAAFIIPHLPAGKKLDFIIKIKSTEAEFLHPQFRIGTQGYLSSTALLQDNELLTPFNCRSGEFRSALEMAMDTLFDDSDWDACFDAANQNSLQYLRTVAMSNEAGNQLIPYQGFNGVMVESIVSCLLPEALSAELFNGVVILLNERFNTLDLIFESGEDCDELLFTNSFNNLDWEDQLYSISDENQNSQIFNPKYKKKGDGEGDLNKWPGAYGSQSDPELWASLSMDPNEKVGPPSYYLNEKQVMSYSIHFENVDTATAAAGMVRIVDTLDVNRFDLSTMNFESFGYNNSVFEGMQDGNSMFAVIDLRPERPVYLKMEAFIDTLSGHVEWVFESLDVNTLQLTDDPDGGFLLPNVNHPEGEGFVNFSIELKNDLSSGDVIENKAEIIFDSNEAIETDYWTNVFDDGLPSSQVETLTDTSFTETFMVDWTGDDAVSGINYYDIYVASIVDIDTTLTIWRYHTSDNSAEFTGEFGEKYYFYSVATDNAGNAEIETGIFDTEVEVSNPCLTMAGSEQFYAICAGDSIMIEGIWTYEEGMFNDTLISAYGCDSIVQSQLTVYLLPEQPVAVIDAGVLSSTLATTYQWYFNGTMIDGATNQDYSPTETGIYSVEVANENGCTTVSEGIQVIISGIDSLSGMSFIDVYPNPTSGVINLQNLPEGDVIIEVYSARGKKVLFLQTSNETEILNLDQFEKGIYHLRIRKDNQTMEKKIIVN